MEISGYYKQIYSLVWKCWWRVIRFNVCRLLVKRVLFEFYWVWFPQSQWRMVLAQRFLNQTRVRITAALQIQRAWRSHKASAWYRKLRSGIVMFQAHIRGYLARRRFREVKRAREEEVRRVSTSDLKANHFLEKRIVLPVKYKGVIFFIFFLLTLHKHFIFCNCVRVCVHAWMCAWMRVWERETETETFVI
jgi:hypothetical protein